MTHDEPDAAMIPIRTRAAVICAARSNGAGMPVYATSQHHADVWTFAARTVNR